MHEMNDQIPTMEPCKNNIYQLDAINYSPKKTLSQMFVEF